MDLKDQLLDAIRNDPAMVRDMLASTEVSNALSSIGILPKILELHAPSEKSRKADGVGETLCGIRGTRHVAVTCRRCKQQASRATAR